MAAARHGVFLSACLLCIGEPAHKSSKLNGAMMLGFAFDNLSRRVNRTIAQWLTEQSVSKTLKGTRAWRRLYIILGSPVASVSVLVTFKVVIAMLWWACPRFLALSIPSYDWTNAEFAAYVGTLWSVQATIAALVYPIVIAFVAV
jgi:hypothetical protein